MVTFASFSALILVVVTFLVVNKDLEWLNGVGSQLPREVAEYYILFEVSFVVTVMMAYVLAIIVVYASNLKLFIFNENHALASVSLGYLTSQVPVTSNDEFGIMATRTNRMIRNLEQRTNELDQMRDVAILGLASLAETRDNETGGHILRA